MTSTAKKVFLVDDDMDIIAQNKMVLEAKGYEVCDAASAKEAEEKIGDYAPDIIILDVMMEHPKAGLEFAGKIATEKDLPKIPIILLTSDGLNPSWLSSPNFTWAKIAKVLDKPVTPEKLVENIEKILK
jgi:CheY-like chemotaxis protein